MKRFRLHLSKNKSYDIIVGYKIISRLGNFLKRLNPGKVAVIITNSMQNKLHGDKISKGLKTTGFEVVVKEIPGRETSKSYAQIVNLLKFLTKVDKGRGIFIIAFGGGTTGDAAGFLASIYKRGIPYVQVPTTLLAQVDSAIGGKTAIDLPYAKNLVGAFYQPRLVVSDIVFLEKLPFRIFKSAFGEIIKYGVIDKELFRYLEKNIDKILNKDKKCLEHIIYRSSRIKGDIVRKDEFDKKGIRARLNFGHTIGHAIETAAGYSRIYYHGEAVALGMIAASEIAVKMGILKESALRRIINLIKKAGLPIKIKKNLKLQKIMKAQTYDKKIIHGVNRFVLPTRIGKVRIYEGIPRRLIYEILKKMRKGN